ncbi:MAG: TIGR03435 family protein [Terracidiphilus sp.]
MQPIVTLRIQFFLSSIGVKTVIRKLAGTILLALLAIPLFAQSASVKASNDLHSQSPSSPVPMFLAADVRRSPHMSEPWMDGPHLEGDRYVVYEATLADLIANAYGIDEGNVVGGPSWLEYDRYDITAKTAATTSGADQKLMLRALLTERFKLAVHNGTAPMPAYVLKVENGQPKLKPSESEGNAGCVPQPQTPGAPPQLAFTCHNQMMAGLAQLLRNTRGGGYLDQPVVDGTGLKGSYDFELKWTPSGGRDRAGVVSVSIFDALESQLGLKLTLETAPRPVLLVDSANETPTPDPPGTDKVIPPPPPPEFEVAVITPAKPGGPHQGGIGRGRMDIHGLSLETLIQVAWDLNDSNKDAIANSPPWLGKDRWDMEAKMSSDDASEAAKRPPEADFKQLQLMLRTLLADRFHLKAHMEERMGTAYNLVAVSPRLTPADPKSRTRCKEGAGPDGKDPRMTNPVMNRLVTCQNMTMAELGDQLQSLADGYIYSTVQDKTGLKGGYNFTLSFSSVNNILNSGGPSPSAQNAADGSGEPLAADPNGAVSLFDAVRRQLGLKLEPEKRPVPVLVIDHIDETPTPN